MPDTAVQTHAIDWLRQSGSDRLVLTANRRLARVLRANYDRDMTMSGRLAWQTPAIFDLATWTDRCYVEQVPAAGRVRLQPAAALLLWERVARRHADATLMSMSGLARQARTAWQRLHDWQVPLDRVGQAARGRDELCFARMLQDYRSELERHRYLDPAEVFGQVVQAIDDGTVRLPHGILLAGFDRQSPLVDAMARAMSARGCRIERLEAPFVDAGRQVHSYIDEVAELRAAGRWARDIVRSDRDAIVALVVADLERDAGRVARLVREGFAGGWLAGGGDPGALVEVSYGQRLSEYPAVAAALLLLRWIAEGLPSVDLSILLRSPFLHRENPTTTAQLERRLRRLPERTWSPKDARRLLGQSDAGELPAAWMRITDAAIALYRDAAQLRPPSQWAERLHALLGETGWPGRESLSSDDFQLVNRWREALNQLAGLDVVLAETSLRECVRRLTQLLADTVWQPEREGALLRIIGPLEAAGMQFDHLWVARSDADRWPPAGRPLPLLSRALQAEHGMPDAVPDDTVSYARRMMSRLAGSAPDVHFSWSRTELDAARSPSPLLGLLKADDRPGIDDPGWFAADMSGVGTAIADADRVPTIRPGETVRGGASAIALQRTEPFQAFATGRLQVRELDLFEPGITAALRGKLIHGALEYLYAGLPAQADMRAWSANERDHRIQAAADRAIAAVSWFADDVFSRLLELERARLVTLLGDAVDSDLARSPFDVVGLEERLDFQHAGLSLELRVDRIDRVGSGYLLILDYKTGHVRNLVQQDGEPAELQLAVYASALTVPVGGLALVFVTRQGIDYRGIGAAIDGKPMESEEWEATLGRWRALVLSLAESMSRGDVRVNLRAPDRRNGQFDVLSRVAELARDH